ncbi:hypothetical protein EDB85DRAFT_1989698 [Lactarius pseudohatsudake]|nr:hypothetical protein EDB85DRAFT_1989698 [Lactarius pseudohatsudake]
MVALWVCTGVFSTYSHHVLAYRCGQAALASIVRSARARESARAYYSGPRSRQTFVDYNWTLVPVGGERDESSAKRTRLTRSPAAG